MKKVFTEKIGISGSAANAEPLAGGYEEPSADGYEEPSADGYEEPSADGYKKPSADGYKKPSADGYKKPSADGYEEPSADGYKKPSVGGYQEPLAGGSEKSLEGSDGKISESFKISARSQVEDFFKSYEQTACVIDLITQYYHLTKDIQRHRGITMGLLAGESEYESKFNALQKTVERRFAVIDYVSRRFGVALLDRERQRLGCEWKTIKLDWQEDKICDNFELHSHFIVQVFQMIGVLSKSIEFDKSCCETQVETDQFSLPRHAQKAELLNFACALLPHMIENMARIRGLASFSAAMGEVVSEHERKLGFYIQSTREQNVKIRHCSQRLHTVLDGQLSAKYVIDELETKFLYFLDLVKHGVLAGRQISCSASSLFELATDVIDGYWGIVDDGLDLFRAWHRQDLENWIARSS